MVTTTGSQLTGTDSGYDGVVRVSTDGYYGTGTLLYDGQAILTAAHVVSDSNTATVYFETSAGKQAVSSSSILIHPDYDDNVNNDLAIIWLEESAPVVAERYTLYREDALGQTITLVGYGKTGTGSTGGTPITTPVRSWAQNTADADVSVLTEQLGSSLSWSATDESQFLADFDDGSIRHDAIGRLLGITDTGLGAVEGLIASGDSGGPAFIGSAIAGVASYTSSLSSGTIRPDIDTLINSSYGEIAAWQRVSFYQEWIDQSLRQRYADAPTTREEVIKNVAEQNSGTTLAFFLLEFTGTRETEDQILEVQYTTRNGTATAGEDYLATAGTLKLYAGETQAVIPVEIIGDTLPEKNETLYMDVFIPVETDSGQEVRTLTAMRTIVDDDTMV